MVRLCEEGRDFPTPAVLAYNENATTYLDHRGEYIMRLDQKDIESYKRLMFLMSTDMTNPSAYMNKKAGRLPYSRVQTSYYFLDKMAKRKKIGFYNALDQSIAYNAERMHTSSRSDHVDYKANLANSLAIYYLLHMKSEPSGLDADKKVLESAACLIREFIRRVYAHADYGLEEWFKRIWSQLNEDNEKAAWPFPDFKTVRAKNSVKTRLFQRSRFSADIIGKISKAIVDDKYCDRKTRHSKVMKTALDIGIWCEYCIAYELLSSDYWTSTASPFTIRGIMLEIEAQFDPSGDFSYSNATTENAMNLSVRLVNSSAVDEETAFRWMDDHGRLINGSRIRQLAKERLLDTRIRHARTTEGQADSSSNSPYVMSIKEKIQYMFSKQGAKPVPGVYAFTYPHSSLIKIGMSENSILSRLTGEFALRDRTVIPEDPVVMGTWSTDVSGMTPTEAERKIHNELSRFHIDNIIAGQEWFAVDERTLFRTMDRLGLKQLS